MKFSKLILASFIGVLFLTSCDENDNKVDTEEKINNEGESREKGHIPSELNFLGNVDSAKGSASKFMTLLRDYKATYGTTDFYNNLFELTSYQLFKDKDFKNMETEDLGFLLDEMRSVKSNMLNIKNISVILIASQNAGVIDKQEFKIISDELLSKNKNKLEVAKWNDSNLLTRKKEELKNQNGKLLYQKHLNELAKLAEN